MDETLVDIGVKSFSLQIQFGGEKENLVVAAQDLCIFIIFRSGSCNDGLRGSVFAPEVLNSF